MQTTSLNNAGSFAIRRFPRYEVAAYAKPTTDNTDLQHRVHNISLGGVCIQSESMEEIGTEIELALYFPEFTEPLIVRGEVVWANRSTPRDMGIRFTHIDESTQSMLKRYLDTIQSQLEQNLV